MTLRVIRGFKHKFIKKSDAPLQDVLNHLL